MGDIFRSQEMKLVNIFCPFEAAHDLVDELARISALQFRDLNADANALSRNFVNEVRRIDDMERRVIFFQEQMIKHKVAEDFTVYEPNIDADVVLHAEGTSSAQVLAELERKFEELESELNELERYEGATRREITAAIEERHVVVRAHQLWLREQGGRAAPSRGGYARGVGGHEGQFGGGGNDDDDDDDDEFEDGGEAVHLLSGDTRSTNLGFVTGVLLSERMPVFRRVLWRATHGNLFMREDDIEEPIPDASKPDAADVRKTAFIIFFQGDIAGQKIRRLCESFNASLYPCPETVHARQGHVVALERRIEELQQVLAVNRRRTTTLLEGHIHKHIDAWRTRVLKEKLIYHTLNLFDYDVQRTTLIAEGWVPVRRLPDVNEALARAHERSHALVAPVLNVVETRDTPPTYFETNKFSRAFQDIVDSYGVPDYQEVNPTPLTMITFPFLFGVMFGDVGHGFLMLLFALLLVVKEKALGRIQLNEMIKTCYDGRYVLLLMSFFSMYMGLMYNECMAVPLDFFGVHTFWYRGTIRPNPEQYLQPYPFGVSPAWLPATNQLNFYNSLKMKLSVLLGVIQMSVGIVLSAFNGIYFRHQWQKRYDFWFEFLPQIVFMLAIFGYMDFLILFKWSTNYMNGEFEAPKLLNLLIAMFQSPGSLDPAYSLYSGQHTVQVVLVLLAVFSIPLMLVAKPLLLRRDWRRMNPNWREIEAAKKLAEDGPQKPPANAAAVAADAGVTHEAGEGGLVHDRQANKKYRRKGQKYEKLSGVMVVDSDSDDSDDDVAHHHHHHQQQHEVVVVDQVDEHDEFDFGEVFVHQMIHTIEFVLGAVSNTASYLRLWALSLAHSELSAVFFDKVAVLTMNKTGNPLWVFIGFAAWAGLTVAVLLLMESLSAFLHALRLHWVESQNKFYSGTGYKFVPVSHASTLKTDEDDE